MSLSLLIDPAFSSAPGTNGSRDLFPDDGEYVGAIAGLQRDTTILHDLPDAIFIELYAYEMLERSCEFAPKVRGEETWRVPFWPASLLVAADISVHALREIERMMAVFDSIILVNRPQTALVPESNRVLGALRFDPELYVEAVTDQARIEGWEVQS